MNSTRATLLLLGLGLAACATGLSGPDLPKVSADKPADLPGLHNVVAYTPTMVSGAVPEGTEGFQTLAKLGFKTVISVDGAKPDVEAARAAGIRYVHLPIGYDSVPGERARELAKAIQTLPGPVYVHCHHGKHRSAAALAAACVTAGIATPETMVARMKVSGTSKDYAGLYGSVNQAAAAPAAELAQLPAVFPEVAKVADVTEAMTQIDVVMDLIKSSRAAGFGVPKNNPDLVPANEAKRMAGLLVDCSKLSSCADKGPQYAQLMTASSDAATALAEGLTAKLDKDMLEKRYKTLEASCKTCHVSFRDRK